MKTRAELKREAKAVIKPYYWKMVGVTLLATALPAVLLAVLLIILPIFAVPLDILWSIFVGLPVTLGLMKFYLNIARDGSGKLGDLFFLYRDRGFWNALSILIFEAVFVFLWGLLLWIPGVIKSIQYFMIDYMLAENPGISRKRAFEITKAGMRGHKLDYFVFTLSFLGWGILCGLTLGIGAIFLAPYMNAAIVQFYLNIKECAIEAGVATEEDFAVVSE